MTGTQKAWLAGIIEGEGCFYVARRKQRDGTIKLFARVEVQMTDEDVIRRIHELTTVGGVGERPVQQHHKRAWRWSVGGKGAEKIMRQLEPYMMSRRKAKIAEVLEEVK